MLISGCSPGQALVIAEALRERIALRPVEHEGRCWHVTASIGVSHFQAGDEAIDAVLDRADAASYRAKRGGRDGVVSDGREFPATSV